jgi:hypothetical protein
MKTTVEKLSNVIIEESLKNVDDRKIIDFEKLLSDMKGLIKKPSYNLPMVDTIGRRYYSSINKRN